MKEKIGYMAYPIKNSVSVQEYLEIEHKTTERYEYFEGEIVSMAGASLNHNVVTANLTIEIGTFLKDKDCFVLPSDMRVTTPDFNSFLYPDISIVCGKIELQPNVFDTLTNPSVIIEVLSPTSIGNDNVFKFHYYRKISSFWSFLNF